MCPHALFSQAWSQIVNNQVYKQKSPTSCHHKMFPWNITHVTQCYKLHSENSLQIALTVDTCIFPRFLRIIFMFATIRGIIHIRGILGITKNVVPKQSYFDAHCIFTTKLYAIFKFNSTTTFLHLLCGYNHLVVR